MSSPLSSGHLDTGSERDKSRTPLVALPFDIDCPELFTPSTNSNLLAQIAPQDGSNLQDNTHPQEVATGQGLPGLPPSGNTQSEQALENDLHILDWAVGLDRGQLKTCTSTTGTSRNLVLHSDLFSPHYNLIGRGLASDIRFQRLARRLLESMKSRTSGIPHLDQVSEQLGSTNIMSYKEVQKLLKGLPGDEPTGILQKFMRRRAFRNFDQHLARLTAKGVVDSVAAGQAAFAAGQLNYPNSNYDTLKKDVWCFIRQMCLAVMIEVAEDFKRVLSGVSKATKDMTLANMGKEEKLLFSECTSMLEDGASGLGKLKQAIENESTEKIQGPTTNSREPVPGKRGKPVRPETVTKTKRTERECICSELTFEWLQRSLRGLALVTVLFVSPSLAGPEAFTACIGSGDETVNFDSEMEMRSLFDSWSSEGDQGMSVTVRNETSPYSMLTMDAICRLRDAQKRADSVYRDVAKLLEAADDANLAGVGQPSTISENQMGAMEIVCGKCADASCSHGARSYDIATLAPKRSVSTRIVDAYMRLIAFRSCRFEVEHEAEAAGGSCADFKKPRVLTTQCSFYSGHIADMSYILGDVACVDESSRGSSTSEGDQVGKCKGQDAGFIEVLPGGVGDIFDYDYLLIPVPGSSPSCPTAMHARTGAVKDWSLIAVDIKNKRLQVYTSHGQDTSAATDGVRAWLHWKVHGQGLAAPGSAADAALGGPVPDAFWPASADSAALASHIVHNLDPGNAGDAGVFICKYADFVAQGLSPPAFPAHRTNYFRARMAHELLVARMA